MLSSYLDNGTLQISIDVDFRDNRSADISQVEVARRLTVAGPARCGLSIDRHHRRAIRVARICVTREIKDVKSDTGVRRKECVLSGNDGHRERKEAASLRRDTCEVGRKRPVVVHVPHGEEAWCRRNTLDGRDELLVILAEDDVTRSPSGPSGGGGLVETERAESVGDRNKSRSLVDLVAAGAAFVRRWDLSIIVKLRLT